MSLKSIVSSATFLMCCLAQLHAAPTLAERFEYQPENDKFSFPEWNVDLFGTWRAPEDIPVGDGRGGVGIGFNYFFTQYWGVGGETFVQKLDLPNHITASFIGRYPMEDYGVAPYLFTGSGYQYWDGAQWTFHVGAGVDYRLNHMTGVFFDVRHAWATEDSNFFLFRAGVRFAF